MKSPKHRTENAFSAATVSLFGGSATNLNNNISINSTTGVIAVSGSTPVGTYSIGVDVTNVIGTTTFANVLSVTVNSGLGNNGPGGIGSPASLQAWFKADAGSSNSADGASVSQWTDQSGNNRIASQATVSSQPTFQANSANGKPALRFDGSNDFFNTNLTWSGTNQMTMFVVANGSNYQSAVTFEGVGQYHLYPWGGGGVRYIINNDGATSGPLAGSRGDFTQRAPAEGMPAAPA
jgi:hypothetical protein